MTVMSVVEVVLVVTVGGIVDDEPRQLVAEAAVAWEIHEAELFAMAFASGALACLHRHKTGLRLLDRRLQRAACV